MYDPRIVLLKGKAKMNAKSVNVSSDTAMTEECCVWGRMFPEGITMLMCIMTNMKLLLCGKMNLTMC